MTHTQGNRTHKRNRKNMITLIWFPVILAMLVTSYWPASIAAGISGHLSGEGHVASLPVNDTVELLKYPPVLCYHQVRNRNKTDSKTAGTYIVQTEQFRKQMKTLHENGYRAILPEQWNDHVKHGTTLPGKPFLLTFDDGTEGQYSNALPELDRYGFKAVFFIMTVTLDKPKYMSRKQVRYLSDHGHVIGCHTWDHHNVTDYNEEDWKIQLQLPTRALEELTGKPVKYFAYPFGSWNSNAINHLKIQGYLAAYQLGGRVDTKQQVFTIRRMIVDGNWDASRLLKEMTLFDLNKHKLQ